jgi:ribosome maturation factor RimP
VSRQLGDLLDVSLESEGPYSLEVTSPGSDRPLGKRSDFERFKGNLARIRLKTPLEGQKNFKGILLGLSENDKVLLSVNNQTVTLPLAEISKARLVNYNGEN